MGIHQRLGRPARSAASVSSGLLVRTQPSRFAMRWTCVSTQIPGLPNPSVTVRFAVFLPTPGSSRSASIVEGTRPPCSAISVRQMARICADFRR